ncbi:MAG: cytochrome P450 [Actinobacteria bacterium]|nr:cytochrome P450 [Actinomycetota bacterium]
MPDVAALDLPVLDPTDPALRGERFHRMLADVAARTWLARTDLGYVVLEREAAMAFLGDRRLAFPSVQILELQGVHDGPVYERTRDGLMAKSGSEHSRLRRLVTPAFTPKATDRLRPRIREMLEELWSRVGDAGETEFVDDFARRLPSMVIAELLGLPGQAERLADWSDALQGVFKLTAAQHRQETEAAYLEVYSYVAELVAERRVRPGEDLVSTLATITAEGDRLTDDECVSLITSVIAGGTDTTQAQLAHGMRLFAEHRDQWERLRADIALAPRAANEVLRFEPITPFTARLVVEEMHYRDVTFPRDTVVFVCSATANRDASAFDAPDRFDITADRQNTPILTFGYGGHYCLGANLARAELAETFAFLAPRMLDLELREPPVFGPPTGIYTMESVPLRFRPGDEHPTHTEGVT